MSSELMQLSLRSSGPSGQVPTLRRSAVAWLAALLAYVHCLLKATAGRSTTTPLLLPRQLVEYDSVLCNLCSI